MASDLLRHGTRQDPIDQALPVEDRVALLRATRIVLEPVTDPFMPGRHDLRMLAAVLWSACVEEEVAEDAPRRRDLELGQQREQAVDHDGALPLARLAEGVWASVERSPDELEVEAEREDPAIERALGRSHASGPRTALTRNMLLSSRSRGRSASRSSSGSQRLSVRERCRGAMRSIQMRGPRYTP